MENENEINQEQLIETYNQLVIENKQLRQMINEYERESELTHIEKRLELVMKIVENKENYSSKIIKLAEKHIKQILSFPKKEKK